MNSVPGDPVLPPPPPPHTAAVMPAAPAPSVVSAALRAWARTFVGLYRSQPGVAGVGSLSLFWVLAALIHGALIGLSADILIARVSSRMYYGPTPSFGVYAAAFVLPVAVSFLYVLARTGTLVALFRVRQRQVRFTDAANIAALGYVAALPVGVALLLFAVLPGAFSGIVVALAVVFTTFLGEASVYVTTAKTGRFERSITVPYAWLTTAWIVLTTVLLSLIAGDLIGNWLADLQSSFWW